MDVLKKLSLFDLTHTFFPTLKLKSRQKLIRIKQNKNKIRMFKTTLIAAIALAGAQAVKISSQATSEANG